MARFDRQIQTALRLIAKNGMDVTYRRIVDGAPADPNKPWNPGASVNTDVPVKICFLPINRDNKESFSLPQNMEIPMGCELGLMGDWGFEPKGKDIIIKNGVHYRIFTFQRLAPNDQRILFKMILQP